jgi:hypothetical protein
MEEKNFTDFHKKLESTKKRLPLYGQIELTYRCGYKCIHCYCKKAPKTELGFVFWKGILDQLQKEQCLELTFTGGDPVLHKNFTKIYSYAWEKVTEIPNIMKGESKASRIVMKELGIPYKDNKAIDSYAVVEKREDDLHITKLDLQPGLIPDVTGMGLRDALPLLENQGLKVRIKGYGEIIKQSKNPGEEIVPGQIIELTLKLS